MSTSDRELLELGRLREILDYDQSTGLFVWKKCLSNVSPVGSKAGRSRNSDGYLHVTINKKFYKCHRLAWFYVHGVWPEQIDHINGDRSDNRITNLRSVSARTNSENKILPQSNNKSGYLGVSVLRGGGFQAEIRVAGKKKFLGRFNCAAEAHAAYLSAKVVLHAGSARAAAEIGKSMEESK